MEARNNKEVKPYLDSMLRISAFKVFDEAIKADASRIWPQCIVMYQNSAWNWVFCFITEYNRFYDYYVMPFALVLNLRLNEFHLFSTNDTITFPIYDFDSDFADMYIVRRKSFYRLLPYALYAIHNEGIAFRKRFLHTLSLLS